MPMDPDKKFVRVRGGLKGFRMIALGDWKREQKEKKGKILKAKNLSPRQKKQEVKRKRKRARKQK